MIVRSRLALVAALVAGTSVTSPSGFSMHDWDSLLLRR